MCSVHAFTNIHGSVHTVLRNQTFLSAPVGGASGHETILVACGDVIASFFRSYVTPGGGLCGVCSVNAFTKIHGSVHTVLRKQ